MDWDKYEAARDRLDYDLVAAITYNNAPLDVSEIAAVVVQLTGENDGADWHWIVRMNDGGHAYVSGGCDYTGWD